MHFMNDIYFERLKMSNLVDAHSLSNISYPLEQGNKERPLKVSQVRQFCFCIQYKIFYKQIL